MHPNRKHLYNEYGAHALKRSYQRNMGIGFLTVFIMVVTVTGAGWFLIPEADAVAPPVEPGPDTTIVRLIPPLTIIPEPPAVSRGGAASIAAGIGIPVPVPDEEFMEDTTVIASRSELAAVVGAAAEPSGENGTMPPIDGETGFYLPPPDTFIALEIYPEMIYEQKPEYPRLAVQAGLEGVLWVKALIDEKGEVLKAIVGRSSGVKSLDNSAIKAAYKNRFKPGIQNGRPVKIWVTYKVKFSLSTD
ncbi:MAG: TonB family protein [bacterium]|nr:TonB family protein [bacterium]